MKIGKVSQRLGVSADTLRYYEQEGMLQVQRDGQGVRDYQEKDCNRVEFILYMRSVGIPIGDIKKIIMLYEKQGTDEKEVNSLLQAYKEKIQKRIIKLQNLFTKYEIYTEKLKQE